MRALGPGSVSSFLKVILDVVYWVLVAAAGLTAVLILVVLLISFRPEWLASAINIDNLHVKGVMIGPILAGMLLAGGLYMAGAIVIVGGLRRIFRTLIAGDPFHPDNVARLRIIGAALAVLEIGRYALAAVTHLVAPALGMGDLHYDAPIGLTTWFAVLVIVVLAEVFREGARLRGEAELTI
jgi:hypothetical protein